MPRWTVQFVYDDGEGKIRVSHTRVTAATKEEAREKAIKVAPTGDFQVSVHPESDEQYLGTVKHKAMIMSGKASKVPGGDQDTS